MSQLPPFSVLAALFVAPPQRAYTGGQELGIEQRERLTKHKCARALPSEGGGRIASRRHSESGPEPFP